MFPLGTVLVPTMVLPLHVFEPRYRELVQDCLAGDREFGVALIERGSEVGGGDTRFDVGCVAHIAEAASLPDGRWALAAVGTRRIRVERWLEDRPYPRATVTDWPDPDLESSGPSSPSEVARGVERVLALLRSAAARMAELGEPAPPLDVGVVDDLTLASHQLVALSSLGPADRQRLLAAPSVPDRLSALESMLAEEVAVLDARLALGG